MIAILSPAKLLDEKNKYPDVPYTIPRFLDRSAVLVEKLKKCSAKKLGEMMDISPELSQLNLKRYKEWHLPFTLENSKQAILTFSGDVYRGMDAKTFDRNDLVFAQDHLRLLSGVYGLLRPLDLMQSYRLMMGTPFSPSAKQKNLYEFWGNSLSESLAEELGEDRVVINLASAEYSKAIRPAILKARFITCDFREKKNGKEVAIQTFVKLARGYMARFIVKNRIEDPEELKSFGEHGYTFSPASSKTDHWVFVR